MSARFTPLHDAHLRAGAKLMPFAGFDMPIRYTTDTEEHLLVRQNVGIFDVSHMGEFLLRGPQALPLIQYITTNDASKLPVGKAQYSCFPNPQGGIVDDLIVYRLEEELYLMVVNASNEQKDWNWVVEQNARFGAKLENISDDAALIAVSGPKALATLKKLTDSPIETMPYYAVMKGQMKTPGNLVLDNVMFASTGYTGERTYEIFVPNEMAESIWNALLEVGEEFGIRPAGLGARDTLRLEMGFMLYGNDLTDTVSPLEAGLGWITKLDKGDFIGSEIFKRQKAEGVKRKLIAFETDGKAIPRSHYPIAKNGRVIGEVSSGTFSPLLKKGIGLGLVETEYAVLGETVDIMIRDAAKPAIIVKAPFVQNTSLTGWK